MRLRKILVRVLAAGAVTGWSTVLAGLTPVPGPVSGAETEIAPPPPAAAEYGRVHHHFVRNDGQLDPEVLYYLKGPRGTVYLTAEEIVFDFVSGRPTPPDRHPTPGDEPRREEDPVAPSRLVFRLRFPDAVSRPAVSGEDQLPGRINYFVGPRENWRTGIPTFGEVAYRGLYPGIDLSIRFREGALAYRFTVSPGTDPGRIALDYSGVEGLEIDPAGELIVLTGFGGFRTPAPTAYQEIDGRPAEVKVSFKPRNKTTVALDIGERDPAHPLVVEF